MFLQCLYTYRLLLKNGFIAYFYTKHEMGLRMAYWFGFAAVAGAFGGLVAFGIQHAHGSVANWRLLFIVEVNGTLNSPNKDLLIDLAL